MPGRSIHVGYLSFQPGSNPYQHLFAGALEASGAIVDRMAPRKWFPLQHAAAASADVLQADWPHDWYQGRNGVTQAIKQVMYRDGLRRLRGRPLVWTAHNLAGHDAGHPEFEQAMIQSLLDVCDGVIVLSHAAGAALRSTYTVAPHTLVATVPHGHYIDCYPNIVTRGEARARLQLPGDGRVVLSLGRQQPYKGLESLIQSFARVRRDGDMLMLAGQVSPASYRHALERALQSAGLDGSRARIVDTLLPADDLQLYFNACDVVALPFLKVLNSGSLLLAMSFGCPVVAPRIGSIPEVACPAGWFGYSLEDACGLDHALNTALESVTRTGMREQIREFTAREYDWRRTGERVLGLYAELLKRHAHRTDPR